MERDRLSKLPTAKHFAFYRGLLYSQALAKQKTYVLYLDLQSLLQQRPQFLRPLWVRSPSFLILIAGFISLAGGEPQLEQTQDRISRGKLPTCLSDLFPR